MMVEMRLNRVFGSDGVPLWIAIVLLLSTPLMGGSWWWPLHIVAVTVILALAHIRGRTRSRINRSVADGR